MPAAAIAMGLGILRLFVTPAIFRILFFIRTALLSSSLPSASAILLTILMSSLASSFSSSPA